MADHPQQTDDLLALSMVREACTNGEARRIRERHLLSVNEVAHAVGAAPSTLSRWERGQRAPKGEAARRYARFLSILAGKGGEPA